MDGQCFPGCFSFRKRTQEGLEGNDYDQQQEETTSGSKAANDGDSTLLETVSANNLQSHSDMEEEEERYNMFHKHRGVAAIFAQKNFNNEGLQTRNHAFEDYKSCEKAFKKLGYKIKKFWDLNEKCFLRELKNLAQDDHSKRDSLVVVVMSHGGISNGQEFINVKDNIIKTCVIWSAFTEDKSPTLAGKPKLIFIQACRGMETDIGIKLSATVQGSSKELNPLPVIKESGYIAPVPRDFLIMWASYPGTPAFMTFREGIQGSVFIHFLMEACLEADKEDELFPLLLKVARRVAIEYESNARPDIDKRKQTTYMVSTLRRRVFFP